MLYLFYPSYLSPCIDSLTGNYIDSLSDAKVVTGLQPTYAKAILRGKRDNDEFIAAQCVTSSDHQNIISVYGKHVCFNRQKSSLKVVMVA